MYTIEEIVNTILCGHSLEVLRQIPTESVHIAITSPPYYGKRDYKTAPQIWGGDPLCEHDWNTVKGKKYSGGTNGTVSYNMDERTHFTEESSTCAKCGAWKGNLGHEPTPELFTEHLCQIFDEVRRVLRKDGTCFVNLGETYYGSGGSTGHTPETKNLGRKTFEYGAYPTAAISQQKHEFLQAKSQCCVPEMFKLEMVRRGWIARNTLIWHKVNCMPEATNDRFTVDFEHVFFFVKNNSTLYWTNEKTLKLVTKQSRTTLEGIDWEWRQCRRCGGTGYAIQENGTDDDDAQVTLESFFNNDNEKEEENQKKECRKCSGTGRVRANLWTGHDYYFEQQFEPYKMNRWGGRYKDNEEVKFSPGEGRAGGAATMNRKGFDCYPNPFGRNMRSVWTIKTRSFKGAHFACYPEELVIRPIQAGCPEFVCTVCGMPKVKILKPTGNYMGMEGYWSKTGGSKTGVHIGCSPTSSLLTKQVQEKAVAGYSDCGCSSDYEPGIVLDPFMGSGTTALVAVKLGRRFIGIDTNPEYVKMAMARIKPFLEQKTIGVFL
jgi:DNA modification methylase